MSKIKAGIIGGAGYTGGELIRILLFHPHVEIEFAHSRSNAGSPVASVHADLVGETELEFTSVISGADVLFLCLGHGESSKWLSENKPGGKPKIIDLSQDFRLSGDHRFQYGLPEFNRSQLVNAEKIANPGCFATAIQLALLPAAQNGLLKSDIQISATTGSTGAGQSLSATSHFTWRYGNHSTYKVFGHQHLAEIAQTLSAVNGGHLAPIHFVPFRGNFTRGIHVVAHFETGLEKEALTGLYQNYFAAHPFTHVTPNPVDVKQVENTNKCLVQVEKINGRAVITSVIDNLLKGASGQAVQNMNLAFGLEETSGLRLKPSAY